jgi:hypothetical protein
MIMVLFIRIYYFIPVTGRRCVLSWVDRRAAPLQMWAGHRRGPWTWAGHPADQATTQGEQLSSVPQSTQLTKWPPELVQHFRL